MSYEMCIQNGLKAPVDLGEFSWGELSEFRDHLGFEFCEVEGLKVPVVIALVRFALSKMRNDTESHRELTEYDKLRLILLTLMENEPGFLVRYG